MEDKSSSPDVEDLIKSIKEHLIINPAAVVGPSYQVLNKTLANLYFIKKEELKAIYHLTEVHAATLRQQTIIRYDYKEDLMKNKKDSKTAHGIDKKYIEFDSEIAVQEEKGLLTRLREMPKEWTVVQVTKQLDPQTTFRASTRPKDFVPQLTCLHITRLPCGAALDETVPVNVLVEAPEKVEGMPTIFDLMSSARQQLRTKQGSDKEILKAREQASQNIKEVVSELSNRYLKEWKCLLLGRLCSTERAEQVNSCVDNILAKHQSIEVDERSRQLLRSVASSAVHLTSAEIESAVTCIVDSMELAIDLIRGIEVFKEELSLLMVANRNPVILILDEELDSLPWEMMNILKKHPVSRVSSIHCLHALFHEHKDHIVRGCRMVNRLDLGYYVINPDKDLQQTESRVTKFLTERIPDWKGVKGAAPTKDQFTGALTENNVFLYSGHFNGSHIFNPEDISKMRVVALPLLFGCSSAALLGLGGRAQPSGVTDKYFMAGCACVVGMLWTVMSDDTDCITATLLNGWLPGDLIDITKLYPKADLSMCNKEPELLRQLRYARETALMFSNSAALIARGIPVKMVEDCCS